MPEPLESDRTVDAPGRAADASAASDRDETAPATSPAGFAAPTFGPPAAPGEVGTLGPYRVVKQLGAGGMGAVYAALDTRLDRQLALKVMLPEFAADRDAKERFLREAKAAAKIKNDNVVTVYEADERNGVPYIAMEFLEGYPLDAYLKQKGAPPLAHVIRIARQIAEALEAAHERGIIHRDLKPANIKVRPDGAVKVLDFGLAKPVGSDTELTKSGAVVGTPAYMSPEQARGLRVDARTDLFSLGAVLYRLCTGKTPFAGPNVMAVMMALGNDDPTPVRDLNPNVPEPLAQLIHQLLAKKPEQRPQTANEVAKRLLAILNQLLAPPPTAVASGGAVPAVSGADLSVSQPVVVYPLPHQPPIVVPMQVTAAPEDAFANLGDDANTASATAAEPAPAAPKPERKKGGKGLLFAAGVAVLLAGVAVAVVVSQMGKKREPDAVQKPPEPTPVVPAPPKDGGKPPAGSIPVLKPVGNEWVDVLALDEKLAETLPNHGPWVKRNGKWSSQMVTENYSKVLLPLQPTGSYSLVAEVSLDAGNEFIGIDLPVGMDRTVVFVFNGYQGTVQGFGPIKGASVPQEQNPTRALQKPVQPGRIFKIALLVKVAGDKVELQATVGDETPIRWAGILADLDPSAPILGRVSLGSNRDCQWTVHSLKFQKIDGEAAVIGWGPPGSDPDRKAAEWVLSVGGSVRVNGVERDIKVVGELPKTWFALTRVDLSDKPVRGADLANLKELKSLNELRLDHNGVTDAGLVHLKELKSLTSLILYASQMTDAGLARLKELKSLTNLDLGANGITDTGLVHLRDCKGLVSLRLTGNHVTGTGLIHLKELKSLQRLDLSGAPVTDAGLVHLKELKTLAHLNVLSTKVTVKGLEALAVELPGCRIEHDGGIIEPKVVADPDRKAAEWALSTGGKVGVAGVSNEIAGVADLPKQGFALTWIRLPDKATDAGLANLAGCKSLINIGIKSASVTDAGLAHLKATTQLTYLDLRDCKVTGEGFVHLRNNRGLATLDLTHTTTTDAGMANLKEFTGLKELRLTYTKVTDAGLVHIKGLTELKGLLLEGTGLNDAGLEHLKELKVLSDLALSGTQVSNVGLVHLKQLQALKSLYLGGTQVSDAGLVHLKDCKNLTALYLNATQVTDAGLAHLKDVKTLVSLNVQKTKVTAKGLEDFAAALPGCRISHDGGVIEPKVVADPDRKAAEWVLSVGGSVGVRVNDAEREIKAAADLPKERLTLTAVKFFDQPVMDADLPNLKELKSLRTLHISATKVTDAGLIHLKELRNLTDLHLGESTGITDKGLVHLQELTTLRTLNLYGLDRVTDAGLMHLKKLTAMCELDLAGTKVTGAGFTHLKEFKSLWRLRLTNAAVTDDGLVHIGALQALVEMDLMGCNQVTDAGLAHMKVLSALVGLNLNNTRVSAAGVGQLKELKGLKFLGMKGSQITDLELSHLQEFKDLAVLDLRMTKVTAKGLEAFAKAMPGCKIEYDGGVIEPKK